MEDTEVDIQNSENNQNIEITNTEQEIDEEQINLDRPLKKFVVSKFLDKSILIDNPMEFKIIKPILTFNKEWKTYNLHIETLDGHESVYSIRLSKVNMNSLMDMFGSNPGSWLDKKVRIKASKFEGEIKGELVKGATLDIESI